MSNSTRKTATALRDYKLSPQKKFGQNFLVNRHTAEAIVQAGKVHENETILEVGVGLGALTQPLARAVQKVIGFEIDSGIIRYHEQEQDLPDNVILLHQDILSADFEKIARDHGYPLKIIANLPYSISNPFIFKLIDNHHLIRNATLMLQKEVGDRLMAKPGCKSYGVPTVLLNSCAVVEKVMTLKPGEFHPRPKVDSVVVHIDFTQNLLDPSLEKLAVDRRLLKKIVRSAFNQRRKTLQNSLGSGNLFETTSPDMRLQSKELLGKTIESAGLSRSVRPENLSISNFILLAWELEKTLNTL